MAGQPILPEIIYPIPKNSQGNDFSDIEDILAHLNGESSGSYLVGNHGMWHGGIHITNATTPWCALSSNNETELQDIPLPYKGEQPLRCMADGEIVAYRINQDYLTTDWEDGTKLHFSGSFLLVKHYIQPGKTIKSGLTFYTLYMHLAPWSAYPENSDQPLGIAERPAWYSSSSEAIIFEQIITPEKPISIRAGHSIGHLGFFQLPLDYGHKSRYQVHIECFSTESNLPNFLSNPEGAGRENFAYFKYQQDTPLYLKMVGEIFKSNLTIKQTGIMPVINRITVSGDEKSTYHQLNNDRKYVSITDTEPVSQFDLAKRGFVTLRANTDSFNLIDSKHNPDNVIKGILEHLCKAATNDPKFVNSLNKLNYQRLLDNIATKRDRHYSAQEYINEIHNPSYRDNLNHLIVEHPSEWYYNKDDVQWKTYLDSLKYSLEWKKYSEYFIENVMSWMKKVSNIGPELWHMHPIVFMDAIKSKPNSLRNGVYIWTEAQGAGHAFVSVHENNNIYVYTYGRYGRTGPGSLTGDGILNLLRAEDALTYYRIELYKMNARVFRINDADIRLTRKFFENLWHKAKPAIQIQDMQNMTQRRGHTIDKYDVTGSNCTTHSVEGIRTAGSKVFHISYTLTSIKLKIQANEDFVIPVSLQNYLINKSESPTSMLVNEMTKEFKKQYFNITNENIIEPGRGMKIQNSAAKTAALGDSSSFYSGGTIGGSLGSSYHVK